MISSCSVDKLKLQLDKHLRNIADLQPGYNNSLDGGDPIGGHYADVLAANYMQRNKIK